MPRFEPRFAVHEVDNLPISHPTTSAVIEYLQKASYNVFTRNKLKLFYISLTLKAVQIQSLRTMDDTHMLFSLLQIYCKNYF